MKVIVGGLYFYKNKNSRLTKVKDAHGYAGCLCFCMVSNSSFYEVIKNTFICVEDKILDRLLTRGWHSYTFNTVIRWTRLTRQTSKWQILCIYKTIRTYMLVHEKTRLRPKSQWTFSDVTCLQSWTFLQFCVD